MPSIEAYGPFKQYSYNKNKTPENIQGYSISYTNPIVEKMFEIINKVCQDKINEFAELNLIKPSKLKATFNYRPKSEDEAKIVYFKLNTIRNHETNLTKFLTKLTDPVAKREIDPKDTISKYGTLTPMIHISKIYYGSHGNSENGASIQGKEVRMKFVANPSSNLPAFPEFD